MKRFKFGAPSLEAVRYAELTLEFWEAEDGSDSYGADQVLDRLDRAWDKLSKADRDWFGDWVVMETEKSILKSIAEKRP